MIRFNAGVAGCALILAFAGCSKDSGAAKTDSAATDSVRDAHDSAAVGGSPAVLESPVDSVRPPVNSTEGTTGETRKRPRMHLPDTFGRDSVIHGPYKTMDSLGQIKR